MSKEFLPFSTPSIEQGEIDEILDTLRTTWITTGPKVKRFEEEFARYIGCKHAVAVNSCTAALHLALEAIGIREGDEVVTSPMTFASTAEVVRYFNARPVFCDISAETMNIDVDMLEAIVRKKCEEGNRNRLKAIIPVHYSGYPCEMDAITKMAMKYDLKVVEDAAHAFPAYYHGRMIGKIGDITCFSFYATKNITTAEGGMITTEDDEWADRCRIMRLHGISKDAWKRYTADGSWYYEITAPGYKYNLTDLAAALGLAQLKRVDALWKRRVEIARIYDNGFKGVTEIERPRLIENEKAEGIADDKGTRHSWHLYVIKLNPDLLRIDRNVFIEELKKKGIGTSVHFIPLHIHPYYRDLYGYKPEDFPVSYGVYRRIVSLPIYPKMTDGDVERVIEAVLDITSKNRRR